jgi:N-acylneuraminate cytidylyltransferase
LSTLGFVFARGGSKGLPGKNVKLLHGKPLLGYALEVGRSVHSVERLFVSTDDEDIAAVARTFGADVIVRPPELATDESPEWLSWQHALEYVSASGFSCQCFVSLPATAPLRTAEDVERCLDAFDEHTDAVLTMTPAQRNPWFNLVMETNGLIKPVMQSGQKIARRQDAPQCYDLATVCYVLNPQFITQANGLFEGRVKGVVIPRERAVDIDDEFDFFLAESLIQARK